MIILWKHTCFVYLAPAPIEIQQAAYERRTAYLGITLCRGYHHWGREYEEFSKGGQAGITNGFNSYFRSAAHYGRTVHKKTTHGDTRLLRHLGGDEFCVFFIGVGSTPQIKAIAEHLCKAMCSLYVPEQQGMPETSCSVGIATCKGQSKDFEMLYG